jgi:MFS family permease
VQAAIDRRETRRNFVLHVFNGATFNFAERLIDPPLTLTWFVSELTSSNLLIGLVAPLGDACWFLPQMFVSARIQRTKLKMPTYIAAAIIRSIAWLLLAATVWLTKAPLILVVCFFALYTSARLASGLAGISFFDITAKTIPARQRGGLFGLRQFLGGILGLGAAWISGAILAHPSLPFPRGHATLFTIYCAVMIPALVAFMMIREPPGVVVSNPVTLGQQIRRAGHLLRENHVYRRYLITQMTIGLASTALPFYGLYAKSVLGAPDGMVGIFVMTRVLAQLTFNLPWGRLSDRRGNQLALRLLALGSGLTAFLALALSGLVSLTHLQGAWLPYLVIPLYVLEGAMRPAYVLTGSNFLLEIVQPAERPLYLGLSNTLMGITLIVSGLGGGIVDLMGFRGVFAIALMLYLLGFVLAKGLPEPRATEG